MPKAIIIGATSGIGRALAEGLAQYGFELGLTGRRVACLSELQTSLPTQVHILAMDVSQIDLAVKQLAQLIHAMQGVDLIILNAGVSFRTPTWEQEAATIQVNTVGFSALARASIDFFKTQGHGHLVGVSSISGIRGRSSALVYSATKAYVSNYLQGMRQRMTQQGFKGKIIITDIMPGFVDTPLIRGKSGHFWIAPVEKAARQIIRAILKKKTQAYITKRWRLMAWALKWLPNWLHERL